jgi:hypothetical protein
MEAALNHYIFEHPKWLAFLVSAFSICKPLACFVFCLAMAHLCGNLSLLHTRSSWKITALLFLFLTFIPALLLNAATPTFGFEGALSFDVAQLSVWRIFAGLILFVGIVLPWGHLLVSTSRLIEQARALPESSTGPTDHPSK